MKAPWMLLLTLAMAMLRPSTLSASPFIGIRGGIGVYINPNESPPSSSQPPPSPEYSALQAFRSAITEDPTGLLSTWAGPNICSYKGIFCSIPPQDSDSDSDSLPQSVLAVDLNHANLKGSIAADLSLLSHLSILHLNSNRFSGPVPDSLQRLQYLTELDLSNNRFSGPFPTATLLIPNLLYLDLRFNAFSGEIPGQLFIKNLDAIFLNNNQFQGQIPMSLWASPASVITLANNNLSGQIPSSFGYAGSNLKEILFFNNSLTGCIPEAVGYLGSVEVLDLSFNSLSGKLPGSISCLMGMEVFNIAHNELFGELSDVICDLRSLSNLTVAYNFFSGFSEDCVRLLVRNVGFDFSGNCIPGRDMQRPPPECISRDLLTATASHWKNTLLGHVLGDRPFFNQIRAVVGRMWKVNHGVQIFSRDNGFFFFRFTDQSDCDDILKGGSWFFDGKLIILWKWKADIMLDRDMLDAVPVWIRISNLPIQLWYIDILNIIASLVGISLFADATTCRLERIAYVHCLVDIRADTSLTRSVRLVCEDEKVINLEVEYEGEPLRCDSCI